MDGNVAKSDRALCPRCGAPVTRHSLKGLCRRCIARVTLPQSEKPSPADSGLRKIVYVDRGEGNFEPRRVETGWNLGKHVEIVSGLKEGENIVVSGNFLIDSESRLKSAMEGMQH